MNKVTTCLLIALLIVANISAYATNYYVDPSSQGSNQGNYADPWKSLDDIPATINYFQPGDTIFFARSQQYVGTLSINSTGAEGAPIVFMPYGWGNPPVFQYNLANPADPQSINRIIIRLNQVNHIVIDGFELTDATIPEADHSITANVGHGVYIYKGHNDNGSHNIIKNLTISRLASGISIDGGRFNTITNCAIRNMRMAVNTSWINWDDHGAVGITLGGSDNTIMHNTIQECWANSFDYQYDGGAIEVFGAASNNKILYNTITDNVGLMEFGSNTGAQAINNVVAYNLLINNGHVFWINTNNGFGVNVGDLQLYNNNIIETKASRLPDVRNLIGISSTPSVSNVIVMKNNIFWLATPLNITDPVTQPFNGSQLTHQNNIYQLNGGSLGYTLEGSERMISYNEPPFNDIYSYSNPIQWDFTLKPSSVAIDFGQAVGIDRDFFGTLLPWGHIPDAGLAEYIPDVALPLQFLSCKGWAVANGNTIEWTTTSDPVDHFEVERSNGGNHFETIAIVQYNSDARYRLIDKVVTGEVQFYRIKAIEPDKTNSYSQIISIRNNQLPNKLILSPNPAREHIYLGIAGDDFLHKEMMLVNSSGMVLERRQFNEPTSQVKLNVGRLPAGVYIIQIIDKKTGKHYNTIFTK